MASQGFIELLRLSDRARKRAEGRIVSEQTLWSGVAFRMGDINMIAPLGEVAEVVNTVDVTAIPKVKAWMKGVANLRGRLLPVCDLVEFTGIVDSTQQTRSNLKKIIVIDQSSVYSGLVVNQVYGIQHFHHDQYVGESLQVHDGVDAYLKGYFEGDNDQVWHVFMMSKLVQDERYLDAAVQ